jgi:putative hemolysin
VIWVCIVFTVGVACYMAALTLSLLDFRRSIFEDRCAVRGRKVQAAWLLEHQAEVTRALSLLRIVLSVLLVLQVYWVIQRALPDGRDLLVFGLAAGVSIIIIWLFVSLLPLALARYTSEHLLARSLWLMRIIGVALMPLTRGLSFIDEATRRLSGVTEETDTIEADLLRNIEDTQREGMLDREAAEMLGNIVEFTSTDVGEVMTPRTDIEGIELTNDLGAIRAFIAEAGHSRIPVYRENLDQIEGILYVKDLVSYLGTEASDFELEPILRKPIIVPETKPVRQLLNDFQRSEIHMAIVVDEYGGTAGLVTIEDVLEEIVGEIHDEHEPDDEEGPTFQRIAPNRVEVDGRFHIDDLNAQLGLRLPEDEEFDTVAGFVLAQLGHVPSVGEGFDTEDAQFTTVEATATHVQRIAIDLHEHILPQDDTEAEEVQEATAAIEPDLSESDSGAG